MKSIEHSELPKVANNFPLMNKPRKTTISFYGNLRFSFQRITIIDYLCVIKSTLLLMTLA